MKAGITRRGSRHHQEVLALARQDTRVGDELEIDDDAKLSEGDDNGCWVQAWMWVDFTGTPLDKDKDES